MAKLDDDVAIVRLVFEIEDLARPEVAAARRVCERLERDWNCFTRMNVERRLRRHGLLDLFGEAGWERTGRHAQWWARIQRDATAYL